MHVRGLDFVLNATARGFLSMLRRRRKFFGGVSICSLVLAQALSKGKWPPFSLTCDLGPLDGPPFP